MPKLTIGKTITKARLTPTTVGRCYLLLVFVCGLMAAELAKAKLMIMGVTSQSRVNLVCISFHAGYINTYNTAVPSGEMAPE